jgi:hypothetical protein
LPIIVVAIEAGKIVVTVIVAGAILYKIDQAIDEMGKRWNPDYEWQNKQDRRAARHAFELSRVMQNSINSNLPPDDDDPWKWKKLFENGGVGTVVGIFTYIGADILMNVHDALTSQQKLVKKKIDENDKKIEQIRPKYDSNSMTLPERNEYQKLLTTKTTLQEEYEDIQGALEINTKMVIEAGKLEEKVKIMENNQQPNTIKSDRLSPSKNGYN